MASTWIISTLPKVFCSLKTQHPSFESEFSSLTTNADRVQFCLDKKVIQHWISLFVNKFESNQNDLKCSKTAAKHRNNGNDYFRTKSYQQAIQLYSAAIRFAPQSMDTASEVSLAYANRSAAYLQLGQHENALKDIDAALAFGYSRFKSVIKLQLRKCDCLIQLGRSREAKEFLLFMQQPIEEQNDSNRWLELFDRISLDNKKNESSKTKISFSEKLTQKGLFHANAKIPLLSTKVAVCYDAEKGRHLVAQKNIQFGDILAVSRPYAALFDSKDDSVKCHHCCRDFFQGDIKVAASLRPVPCTSCSSVMYCSEECRAKSSDSYHRYECGQHTLLVQFLEKYRIALRIVYSAGMDQIRWVVSNEQEKHSSYFSEQPEDHYSHVYHLVHNSDGPLIDLDIPYMEMLESSLLACILLQLAKLGHFPMNTKEDEKLIGSLLLRHLQQLFLNALEYCPLNKVSSSPVTLDLFSVYASILNHSCKANARLEAPTNEYVCLLQATRPISAGTEITISYLKDRYSDHEFIWKFRRQLSSLYRFQCKCAQCTYEIRNMPFGDVAYNPLGCSDCGHLIERTTEQSSQFEVFRCTNCPLELTHTEVKQRYHQLDQLRILGKQLIDQLNRRFVVGQNLLLQRFESNIGQFEALLHRDSAMVVGMSRNIMACYYMNQGRVDKWWACNEQFLSAIEHRFGSESLQFINEFDRIQKSQVLPMAMIRPSVEMRLLQQDNKLYERYLARIEQWKQLKLKYCAGY